MNEDRTVRQSLDVQTCLDALEQRIGDLPREHQSRLAEPLAALRTAVAASQPAGTPDDQARSERAYREDEQPSHLEALLSCAPIGMALLDRDLRCVYINDQLRAMSGSAPVSQLGGSLGDVLPGFARTVEPLLRQVLATGAPIVNHELRNESLASEQAHYYLASYYPVQAQDEALVGVAVTEITAQKQAQEALHSSEERFRAIWELASDAMVLSDPHGIVIDSNQAYCQLYGYSPEEVIGKDFSIIFPKDEQAWAKELYIQTFHDQVTPSLFESSILRADGTTRQVESRINFLTDNGERVAMLSIIRDITERKRAQSEHSQRMDQLRELADASLQINAALSLETILQIITQQARMIIRAHQSITSLALDANWAKAISIVDMSDKYAAWLNYSVTSNGSDIYAEASRINRPMRLTQAELEAHSDWYGVGAEGADHPPLRGWLSVPLSRRDGVTIGLIQLSDKYIGEFSESDEVVLVQLAQLASVAIENARLFQAAQEAVRVRDQFLSIASHELKTPLTSLYGHAQLLLRRAVRENSLSERDHRTVTTIVEQAERMNEMITALLDLSRLQAGQLNVTRTPVDLCTLVRRLVVETQPTLEQHTLQLTCVSEPLVIIGDAMRLEQVVQNLLQNAVKYSPHGGPIEMQIVQQDERACLIVRDQGIGIPSEVLPRLFQRFFRAPNADSQQISGTGIGLYVVKEIVTMHGGTVEVESVEGEGSTFTVCLPLLMRYTPGTEA